MIGDKTFIFLKNFAERRDVKMTVLVKNILADFVEKHGLAPSRRPPTVSTRKSREASADVRYEPDEPVEEGDLDDLDLESEEEDGK